MQTGSQCNWLLSLDNGPEWEEGHHWSTALLWSFQVANGPLGICEQNNVAK